MKKMILFAVMAVAVVSCENMKEIDAPVESQVFKALIADTKTTLVDNVKLHWVAEDAISVFGNDGTNYWVGTSGSGASVTFDNFGQQTPEAGLVASQPYAVYPYWDPLTVQLKSFTGMNNTMDGVSSPNHDNGTVTQNSSLFDFNGNRLAAWDAFKYNN